MTQTDKAAKIPAIQKLSNVWKIFTRALYINRGKIVKPSHIYTEKAGFMGIDAKFPTKRGQKDIQSFSERSVRRTEPANLPNLCRAKSRLTRLGRMGTRPAVGIL